MIYYIFFGILLSGALYCLWCISVTDFRRRIIPDVYLFPLLLIGLVITEYFPWISDTPSGIIAAACGYAMSAIIGYAFEHIIHPKRQTPPIGLGDIKLISVGGIWMGPAGLAVALTISCILGIVWGRAYHQKYIPFAPFFAVGGILAFIILYFLI